MPKLRKVTEDTQWQKMVTPALTHLTGDRNYVWLHYAGTRKAIMSCTLKEWETRLPDFIRISKQAMINLKHIQHVKINLTNGNTKHALITLSCGAVVRVSSRKVAETLETIINQ